MQGKRTAVVVDAIAPAEPWLRAVNELLQSGLTQNGNTEAGVIYISNGRVERLANGPRRVGSAMRGPLQDLQGRVQPVGKTGFWAGFDAGLASDADELVFITGRTRWGSVVKPIEIKMRNHPRLKLSFISVGERIPELAALAKQSKGRYEVVSQAELNDWAAAR